jgi:hypothetical protein
LDSPGICGFSMSRENRRVVCKVSRKMTFSLGIQRPLAVLHRAVTPEAVREEVERLTRADRMAGCLGDLGWMG